MTGSLGIKWVLYYYFFKDGNLHRPARTTNNFIYSKRLKASCGSCAQHLLLCTESPPSSDNRLFIRPDGFVDVITGTVQTRVDALVSRLLLREIGRRFDGWTRPQSAVQDGEDDAVEDENPIEDVTCDHVFDGLCTQKTHHRQPLPGNQRAETSEVGCRGDAPLVA